jgi:hypothetical protein
MAVIERDISGVQGSNALDQLRTCVDGDDQFMGAHQILKIRRPKKKVPSWANNDKKIQEFVRRSFPKMDTNTIQRRRAARWAAIIYWYYRQNFGRLEIARRLGMSINQVRGLLGHIKLAARGMKANGRGPGGKPNGRPKRKALPEGSL